MNEGRRRGLAAGLVVLALAAGGAGLWLKLNAPASSAAWQAPSEAARARNQEALSALLREGESKAASAAQIRELVYSVDHVDDAGTLRDFFVTEEPWEPIRKQFSLSAVVSPAGVIGNVESEMSGLADSPAVQTARDKGAGSGLLVEQGRVYLLAAARVAHAEKEAARRAVLVLGQPADHAILEQLGARSGDVVAWSNGQRLIDGAGAAPVREALARLLGQEQGVAGRAQGAVAELDAPMLRADPATAGRTWLASPLSVAPGLWLWIAFAVPLASGLPAAALAAWALAGVLALVGLALWFGAGKSAAPVPLVTSPHSRVAPRPREDASSWREETLPSGAGSAAEAPDEARKRPGPGERATERSGGGRGPTAAMVAMSRPSHPAQMGRYRLLKLIGEGGMAEVYIASAQGAEGFERHFVVKRLHPHLAMRKEIVSQFIDEARLQVRLQHSNVVSVFDFGRAGDEYFLALEYVHGRDLEQVMQSHRKVTGRPLPLSVVFHIAHEVLEALAYAHGRTTTSGDPLGIVHRDVSPSNVLISFQGEVKLSDFGIVKADGRVSQTDVGVVKGNVSYMSPEQARGESVDQRSDLFSLAMVMFYCLTGRSLYGGPTHVNQLMRAAVGPVTEQFSQLSDLPPHAQDILARAIARDPASRFQSATEFARALVGFGSGARAELGELMRELFVDEMSDDF